MDDVPKPFAVDMEAWPCSVARRRRDDESGAPLVGARVCVRSLWGRRMLPATSRTRKTLRMMRSYVPIPMATIRPSVIHEEYQTTPLS